MLYRLAPLMLMAALLLMSAMILPAAPVPEPASAVLDIGPPEKGKTVKEHCKQEIDSLKHPNGHLMRVGFVPDVKKMSSVARLKAKEIGPWMVKNIRIKEEEGGRRLRFTFRAGRRAEQVAIINALLHAYMGEAKQSIKDNEEFLRPLEERAALYSNRAKEEQDPEKKAYLQGVATRAQSIAAPARAVNERLKQIAVIKWAK